jgi:hypothetical protein
MGGKTAIALGLVAGLVVGGLIVGGAVGLVPGPGNGASTTSPAPPAASSPPQATEEPSAAPSVAAPSTPASDAPSAPASEQAPPLVLPLAGGDTVDLADDRGKPDADGIVRDGALGGIGPDVMAQGLGTILPEVTVTS